MSLPEEEIPWLEATRHLLGTFKEKGNAALGKGEPDPRPLVALLRGGTPIPQSAREMLADMIDPDGDGFLRWRLLFKDMSNKRNNTKNDMKKLLVWHEYNERTKKGERSEVVALDLAEKKSVGLKTIYNYIRDINNLQKWLGGAE